MATKTKKKRFKTIENAEKRIRLLERRIKDLNSICTRAKGDYQTAKIVCLMLAKLSADGPAFDNPLDAMAAKQGRDMILFGVGLNPDGTKISK